MGLDYEMIEARGPFFPKTIQSKSDIDQLLTGEKAADRLDYVYNTITEINKNIPENIPLIGSICEGIQCLWISRESS